MQTFAHFASRKTSEGIKIFRYFTEFHSPNGPGDVIGLIVMMNPGEARPISDHIFTKLSNGKYETNGSVETKPDNTMGKVIRMINDAFSHNNLTLPMQFTIHVENLFNVREKDNEKAKKIARSLRNLDDLMFKPRELNDKYGFVFLAWGNVRNINQRRQQELYSKFPEAIKVHKLNHKGRLLDVEYPVHPLYMNTDFFLEASIGKIRI